MKIRTQFRIIVALFGAVLVAVAVLLLLTNGRLAQLKQQENAAHEFELYARELSYLSNDYLLHGESEQRNRWEARFATFADRLTAFVPATPERSALINEMAANQRRLKTIFLEVSASLAGDHDGATTLALIRMSWSRMEVQNQALAFASMRLARLVEEEAKQVQQRRAVLLLVLFGTFIIYLVGNYALVSRRMLRGMADLRSGAQIIGSGNLAFTITEKKGDDEIRELARAFNRMTADLKAVTASKADLEMEVNERRQAQEALKQSRAKLQTALDGMRAGEERLRASLEEKEVLLKEIHHRVKNNMQVISSLVALQAEELQEGAMRAVLAEVAHRVRSMAMVHEKLYQSPDLAQVDFADYSHSLLTYLQRAHPTAADIRLDLDLSPLVLPVNLAVPCGLILNELFSNALKHAFPDNRRGRIRVVLGDGEQGRVRLSVADDGIGLPPGFDWNQAHTLGLRLLRMLVHQLRAELRVSVEQGTTFSITFDRPQSNPANPTNSH